MNILHLQCTLCRYKWHMVRSRAQSAHLATSQSDLYTYVGPRARKTSRENFCTACKSPKRAGLHSSHVLIKATHASQAHF